MDKQKGLLQLQVLEQEANHYGEQLRLIGQQINEMGILKNDVKKIEINQNQELFAGIGKGIYIKGKLVKSDLLIEVGSNVFVPKTAKEVENIIEEQIKKLKEAEKEIGVKIESINRQLTGIINELHKPEKTKEKQKKD